MDTLDKQRRIFVSLFIFANKLQVIGDRFLGEDGMTAKQWLLSAMISQFRDGPPSLSEVAELMGSSRQNVKQLALKLEENDFIKIEKDEKDARAVRLKLTEKSRALWEKRQDRDEEFLRNLFSELGEDEIDKMHSGFDKLFKTIDMLEQSIFHPTGKKREEGLK